MVSLIIPVMNNEGYLDACISSVLQQTYSDFELLLMVGMCRDKSLEKCLEWQKKDERIIVVSRKDTSLGDARNYAFPIAKGDYIAYLDADDRLEKNYLEEMVEPLIENPNVDLSCCGFSTYRDGALIKEFIPDVQGFYDVDFGTYLHLGVFITVWTKVYRKSFLNSNEISMFDGLMEDSSLEFMLASVLNRVYVCQKSLYRYTLDNEDGLVNSREYEARVGYVDAVSFAMDYMKKHGVYEENKKMMSEIVCGQMYYFLAKYNFDNKLQKVYTSFIEKNFKEMRELTRFCLRKVQDKAFVMFGAGREAFRMMKFKPHDVEINYIVDSKSSKTGGDICGVPIKYVEELLKEQKDIPILISTRKYRFEIEFDLKKKGFTNIYYIEDLLTPEQLNVRM